MTWKAAAEMIFCEINITFVSYSWKQQNILRLVQGRTRSRMPTLLRYVFCLVSSLTYILLSSYNFLCNTFSVDLTWVTRVYETFKKIPQDGEDILLLTNNPKLDNTKSKPGRYCLMTVAKKPNC